MFNSDDEIKNADQYPDVRMMTVKKTESSTPREDLVAIKQLWTTASKGL